MTMALTSLDDACAWVGPATVVVEAEGRVGTGFLAGGPGLVVTAFHLVADASAVTLRLPSGRKLAVDEVMGIDARRNIAVLRGPRRLPSLPVALHTTELVEGTRLFAQAAPGDTTSLVLTRAGASERVGELFTVCLLPALSAETAPGSPLVGENGLVVGLVTRVLSNVGPLPVGVPAAYLKALFEGAPQPLAALHTEGRRRKAVRRSIPTHPLSLLDGSSAAGLAAIGATLVTAIQTGAPAYNEGDVDGCYRIYEEAARRLLIERDDCPGPQRALRDGLTRAAALGDDVNAKAWAMRDTFDGLLMVLERHQESRRLFSPAAPKKNLLN